VVVQVHQARLILVTAQKVEVTLAAVTAVTVVAV
jgi:hypothetical protein